jgi:DNA-binding LacI/PurR family transcriptional regulator
MKYQSFVPLYLRLFDYYREKIIKQEYKPGERIDSITRLMQKHNVSRETAKIVLSKLAEEKYIIKRAGKGSFVTYRKDLQKIWGIVIPFLSSNIEELIENLYQEAKQYDRQIRYLLHYNDPEEEMRQVGTMIRDGYEAIMIVPNYNESLTANFYRNLSTGSSVIILLDNTMVGSFFNYVIQSYDLGAKRAFNYLSSQNPKNLLFVKDESWRGNNLVLELIENSLKFFIGSHISERKLYNITSLQEVNENFIKENNIGGILCWSDTDGIRLARRIMEWNMKFTTEISLVSYGNTELTVAGKTLLTVIDCKYPEMARLAASMVFCEDSINETQQFVLEPELVIRKT